MGEAMLERIKHLLFIAILLITIFSNNNAYAACDEKDLYCSIPGGTRRVNGVDVKRDCWQYKYKMDCARNSKNDCHKIDHDNCTMVAEDCISNCYASRYLALNTGFCPTLDESFRKTKH